MKNKKWIKKIFSFVLSVIMAANVMQIYFVNAEELNQDMSSSIINVSADMMDNVYIVSYPSEVIVDSSIGANLIEICLQSIKIRPGTKLVVDLKSTDQDSPSKLAMYRDEDQEKNQPIYLRLIDYKTYDDAMQSEQKDTTVVHPKLLKSHDQTQIQQKEYVFNVLDVKPVDEKYFRTFGVLDILDDDYIIRSGGTYRGQLQVSCSVQALTAT